MSRGPELDRRELLRAGALSAAVLGTGLAAPDDEWDLVPADKGLDAEWLASLQARGEPASYTGDDLVHIGMPIGGICTGTLYLAGDGRLWHWDVFNTPAAVDVEPHYVEPLAVSSPLQQRFAIEVAGDGATQVRTLDSEGFTTVSFRGAYPIGRVDYSDADCPVSVHLEAFSPFIPLNADDSSLPVTVMRFSVKNLGDTDVRVTVGGLLENAVAHMSAREARGERRNRVLRGEASTTLLGYAWTTARDDEPAELDERLDQGSLALAIDGRDELDVATARLDDSGSLVAALFASKTGPDNAAVALRDRIFGGISRRLELGPRETRDVVFLVSWFFPNARFPQLAHVTGIESLKRHYATRFDSAAEVVEYVLENLGSLTQETRLWHDTWYDSTLPYWLLDRSLANASTLATSTCVRFDSGRFYGFESAYRGPGTCTHVWHHAQAVARLFPELERSLREKVDFDVAFHEDTGAIDYRGEAARRVAIDGQAGVVLRSYREHTMSADDAFLRRSWPRIRKAVEYLIHRDQKQDGILDGGQFHTFEERWYGKVPWLSSLYLAALRAAEAMARELEDEELVDACAAVLHFGPRRFGQELWNGEYYAHEPDPEHPEATSPGQGCFAEQVLGQGWTFQVGLPRVLPPQLARTALHSIYRYAFTPDAGDYRERFTALPPGRVLAASGERGLLTCTWPRGGDGDVAGESSSEDALGRFSECLSGTEYQVAAHLLWEGMLDEGLALARAVHDRYHPSKRNPWNEVEGGDHAARAMASYAVFLAACGFEVHGPSGHLGFAPRLAPDRFRAAFVGPEGWGTIEQTRERGVLRARVIPRWGRVRLRSLALDLPLGARARGARATVGADAAATTLRQAGSRLEIRFADQQILTAERALTVETTL